MGCCLKKQENNKVKPDTRTIGNKPKGSCNHEKNSQVIKNYQDEEVLAHSPGDSYSKRLQSCIQSGMDNQAGGKKKFYKDKENKDVQCANISIENIDDDEAPPIRNRDWVSTKPGRTSEFLDNDDNIDSHKGH